MFTLPTVMLAMVFLTASLFLSFLSEFNSDFNSNISPFLVVVKYFESVIFISENTLRKTLLFDRNALPVPVSVL
jgi:hypothetical protein